MLCINDYEAYAKEHLDEKAWAFYSQGAEREETLQENLRAYTRYTLVPRMLINVDERDLSTTILGYRISMPVGLAPTGFQKMAHPDGELAASRAAEEIGTVYTLSTVANTSLEDVANYCNPRSHPLFMQIYMVNDKSTNEDLIRKAEASGYKAIVLTIDAPVLGLQLRMGQTGRLQLPPHLSTPNVTVDSIQQVKDTENLSDSHFAKKLLAYDVKWEDITWIKSITNLPIVLKGILTVEDAKKAVIYGASAVWISNHGGRELDGVSATIDSLSEISTALKESNCEMYVDGGVRWGSDILKALALGARVVFIGRPVIWGLAHSGQEGVRNALEILKSELDRAMHLIGCRSVGDIGSHFVQKKCFCKI